MTEKEHNCNCGHDHAHEHHHSAEEMRMQEMYMELQNYETQIKQMQAQYEQVDEQIGGLKNLIEMLKNLKEVKEGHEVYIPVSNGIFLKANSINSDDYLVNVGSNVAVPKTSEATQELIDKQINELENYKQELIMQITNLDAKAGEIEEEFRSSH